MREHGRRRTSAGARSCAAPTDDGRLAAWPGLLISAAAAAAAALGQRAARRRARRAGTTRSGLEPLLAGASRRASADPDRLGTIRPQLAGVSWSAGCSGSATGDAEPPSSTGRACRACSNGSSTRPCAGSYTRRAGTVDPELLRGGAAAVGEAAERWRITRGRSSTRTPRSTRPGGRRCGRRSLGALERAGQHERQREPPPSRATTISHRPGQRAAEASSAPSRARPAASRAPASRRAQPPPRARRRPDTRESVACTRRRTCSTKPGNCAGGCRGAARRPPPGRRPCGRRSGAPRARTSRCRQRGERCGAAACARAASRRQVPAPLRPSRRATWPARPAREGDQRQRGAIRLCQRGQHGADERHRSGSEMARLARVQDVAECAPCRKECLRAGCYTISRNLDQLY